jgi:hypothetical protein
MENDGTLFRGRREERERGEGVGPIAAVFDHVAEELSLVEAFLLTAGHHLQVLEERLVLAQRVDEQAHSAARRHRVVFIRHDTELHQG